MPNPIEKWKNRQIPEGKGGPNTLNLRGMPSRLVMEAKAVAALQGKTLKQFVIEAIQQAVKEGKRQMWAEDQP